MNQKPLKSETKKPGSRKNWSTSASILGVITVVSLSAIGNNSKLLKKDTKSAAGIQIDQIKNWGIANKRAESHIQALDAWKLEQGSNKITVAVIDTGLDANHPDLKPNVYRNESGNYGWNFTNNQPDPTDDHGHGTHVAGIIGAIANPKTGASGVAQHVSIMAVKYYSESNTGAVNLKNTVKAIEYAVANGAKIINYSGGGPEFSQDEFIAIKKAEAKGVLFVAAAGNERQNTDLPENYYYPSAYKLTNIISVAANDINNKLIRSSNWGKAKVDVSAPGENIYSTLPNERYGYMTGTSQATAFVSGIAALLLSKKPDLTPAQLKEIIRNSVDTIPDLKDKVASGGRVNAYKALLAVGAQPKNSPNSDVLRSLARGPSSIMELIFE